MKAPKTMVTIITTIDRRRALRRVGQTTLDSSPWTSRRNVKIRFTSTSSTPARGVYASKGTYWTSLHDRARRWIQRPTGVNPKAQLRRV